VSPGRSLLAIALADVWALLGAAFAVRRPSRRLVRTNHAGRDVPAVLGQALVIAVVGAATLVAAGSPRSGDASGRVLIWSIGAVLVLGLVGLLDDLAENRARGFRGHLGSLRHGTLTTGTLKLATGVAAGTTVAVLMGGGLLRVAAAAVVMALSTNVWNALDVIPGRALKAGIVALLLLLWVSWGEPVVLLVGAALGASVALLPFDLLERGMLGDAGSNPLGFVVGVGLAATLPTYGLVVAAGVGLLLQFAAETVTISRLVEAAPPVRWLDRLGRRS
jgi:UDP-GlcNAc:undecaprenyl-phosphate/decaprenyl-phosphate GlcNAc-1-phosphate transferase